MSAEAGPGRRGLYGHLRANLWWWIVPMVIVLALLVYLAWKQAHVPNAPFTYEIG